MADYYGSSNWNVSTSTMEHLVAATVDTVLTYSPATLFFLGNQKPWRGSQMRFPIKYAQNTEGMWFTGLERFSTTSSSNFVYGTASPTGREINCVVSQIELDLNASERVIDLLARRLASDAQDMAHDIADSFYAVQTGNAFLSILEGCDDDTLGADTYLGLDRGTYGLAGSVTNIGGNITLAGMRTSYNACVHGSDSPNLILCTKAVWGYYEKLATPTVQHNVQQSPYTSFVGATVGGLPNLIAQGMGVGGNLGFRALYWNGVPVVADEHIATGYMYMLNTRNWAFYGVKSTDPDYKTVKFTGGGLESPYSIPATTGFSFSGFNKPVDQYGKVGHIILVGNLICNQPRNQAILYGITGA